MMDHTIYYNWKTVRKWRVHEVGNRLAERLNIPLYDHNLIRMAARDTWNFERRCWKSR